MPSLNEYIAVGFCSGYGDGDYRVNMSVRDLSKNSFQELQLATLQALRCAEDQWRDAEAQRQIKRGEGPVQEIK